MGGGSIPPTAFASCGGIYPSTSNHMAKISFQHLVNDGQLAASAWNECDIALTACNESFGAPFEASKAHLQTNIAVAAANNFDLSVFSGKDSAFKYPDLETNIIVRVTRIPTMHSKIDKIDEKIAKLEQQLKVAKIERKRIVEQLAITGAVDLVTDKIALAFTRLK